MKFALVSKEHPYENGFLVVDIEEQPFTTVPSMIWVECADDVFAGGYYYIEETNEFVQYRPSPLKSVVGAEQPQVSGAQTI